MTNRAQKIEAFLAKSGWSEATRSPLAGDASNRRYERLSLRGQPAVLMDAPPEKGEDVRPFVQVAEHLTQVGLSAPDILAVDAENGFLLLEDLGDALFARVIPDQLAFETPLYEAATDVLLALHKAPALEGLKPYDAEVMSNMAALAHRWYADTSADSFLPAFRALLETHITDFSVLIQRDYHAENLLWLPERVGPARVGLLDFQDAMLGHPAYDLVSLLQDARRDVPPHIEVTMLNRYISASGQSAEGFKAAYALLGAQRNLRILGVFARLSLHFNKPHYVDFIPRVWAYLMRDLEHPVLADLRYQLLADLPAPSETLLKELKEKCGTVPTL
ncbi:phosphotransferase [Lentibacter algarum]|uniref:aminoglycoside phosphotransferase family protein n=1 Tax=Lentibacter algarum TaxID=576131 RepID=UPI001C075527|nr:phosphotransferase [Lentibacter algarum]MBU2980358.1 phosphotransferase [Lentibacter algarum]